MRLVVILALGLTIGDHGFAVGRENTPAPPSSEYVNQRRQGTDSAPGSICCPRSSTIDYDIGLTAKGLVTSGDLGASDQLAVVETVVRYAAASAHPPCTNHGSKEAICLEVGSEQEVSPRLLRNLSDLHPPILPLTACRKAGLVGELEKATDPIIQVQWLRVISDSAVQARVIAYCATSEPTVQKRGRRWVIALEGSGWISSCLVPGDCVH